MKPITLSLIGLSLTAASSLSTASYGKEIAAAPSAPAYINYLAPEKIALQLIDERAGDTWAEASSVKSLKFLSVQCEFQDQTCVVEYSLKLYDQPTKKDRCVLKKMTGYHKLFQVGAYSIELTDQAVDQLNDCFDSVR